MGKDEIGPTLAAQEIRQYFKTGVINQGNMYIGALILMIEWINVLPDCILPLLSVCPQFQLMSANL